MSGVDRIELDGIGMTSERTRLRLVARLREQGIADERVLAAIAITPRHLFVDEALAQRAYEDTALPIGFNQTLTQPLVCARMVAAILAGGPLERVLEVGTGSGYQTALLAQLVTRVYTVERIRPLQARARERMRRLGLSSVQFRHGDGLAGWPERAPFDGIVVSASPRSVPEELVAQLSPGGRMVIPVGDQDGQELQLVTRNEGGISVSVLEQVRFVPLLAGKVD